MKRHLIIHTGEKPYILWMLLLLYLLFTGKNTMEDTDLAHGEGEKVEQLGPGNISRKQFAFI